MGPRSVMLLLTKVKVTCRTLFIVSMIRRVYFKLVNQPSMLCRYQPKHVEGEGGQAEAGHLNFLAILHSNSPPSVMKRGSNVIKCPHPGEKKTCRSLWQQFISLFLSTKFKWPYPGAKFAIKFSRVGITVMLKCPAPYISIFTLISALTKVDTTVIWKTTIKTL